MFGAGTTFLFTFHPDRFSIFKWTRNNDFFLGARMSTQQNLKGEKGYISAGGGGLGAGVWLSDDLIHGSSHCCQTFNNDCLASSEDFKVKTLEVWTLHMRANRVR